MKTFSYVSGIIPGAREEHWRKHDKGGGWVQKTARISPDATIEGGALVYGNAQVLGTSMILSRAQVRGEAIIQNDATVGDRAIVEGHARVSGNSFVIGDARIKDHAHIGEHAIIESQAEVGGNAEIGGWGVVTVRAKVYGEAKVLQNGRVSGSAEFGGQGIVASYAEINAGKWMGSPLCLLGTRHQVKLVSPTAIQIGCETHLPERWLAIYKNVGTRNGYNAAQQAEYKMYIDFIIQWLDTMKGVAYASLDVGNPFDVTRVQV